MGDGGFVKARKKPLSRPSGAVTTLESKNNVACYTLWSHCFLQFYFFFHWVDFEITNPNSVHKVAAFILVLRKEPDQMVRSWCTD